MGSDVTSGSVPKGHSHPVEKEIGCFQEEGLLEAKGLGWLMWGVGRESEKVAKCFLQLESHQ